MKPMISKNKLLAVLTVIIIDNFLIFAFYSFKFLV